MAKLTLLGLPIGNAEDITLRGLQALKEGVFFLAEDTRNLSKLMQHLEIDSKSKQIESFHEHNKQRIDDFVEKMKGGQSYFLVSDAGSPIISDPAYPLVRSCLEAGIEVETLPGVSAVTVALELSGLAPCPFHFHGFLPRGERDILQKFEQWSSVVGTHIFFESPHRLMETLSSLELHFPECQVVVARELTKRFESVYRFRAGELQNQEIKAKGEVVLLIHFETDQQEKKFIDGKLIELVENYIDGKRGPKLLAKIFSKLLDQKSSDIYQRMVQGEKE